MPAYAAAQFANLIKQIRIEFAVMKIIVLLAINCIDFIGAKLCLKA